MVWNLCVLAMSWRSFKNNRETKLSSRKISAAKKAVTMIFVKSSDFDDNIRSENVGLDLEF